MNVRSGPALAYDLVAAEYEERACAHAASTQTWADRLVPHVAPGASVLDVGCGVGVAMSLLAARGLLPTGIDASAEMARYARARNPGCPVLNLNIFSAHLRARYDVVWAEAFIHLFPSGLETQLFDRLLALLMPHGILTLSTTLADQPEEGFSRKADYAVAPLRFRRHWTRDELAAALADRGLTVIDQIDIPDSFGKRWMVYICRSPACANRPPRGPESGRHEH